VTNSGSSIPVGSAGYINEGIAGSQEFSNSHLVRFHLAAVTGLLPLLGYPCIGGRLYMSNEQLTWTEPFIYQEWPVRLAHQSLAEKCKLSVFSGNPSANLCVFPPRPLRTGIFFLTTNLDIRCPVRGATFTGRQSRSKRSILYPKSKAGFGFMPMC